MRRAAFFALAAAALAVLPGWSCFDSGSSECICPDRPGCNGTVAADGSCDCSLCGSGKAVPPAGAGGAGGDTDDSDVNP